MALIVRETFGNTILDFSYDSQGNPYTLTYTVGTATPLIYHYVVNLQGDVIRIVNAAGVTRVTYEYDAWGNIISTTSTNAALANANPLRYRGYVYDSETGLYYLNSRYYDPAMGRFISADSVFDVDVGLQGYNIFAFCGNNPVNRIDSGGADSEKNPDLDLADDELSERGGGGSGIKVGRFNKAGTKNDPVKSALKKLNSSGIRPGQTHISRKRIMEIVKNYSSVKAYSSIYSNGEVKYIVDGHHTTVANTILGRGTDVNMGTATNQLPSAYNIYWAKKWYEFGKTVIKIID